jgi:uncharacterized protein YunC (DUF1805 family)
VISITSIKVDDKTCLGVRVELPDSPPLLLVMAEKGFVMCGFLNMEAAERMNVTAAMVSGVKTFEDVLNAQIKATTTKAKNLGIQTGMRAIEALEQLS